MQTAHTTALTAAAVVLLMTCLVGCSTNRPANTEQADALVASGERYEAEDDAERAVRDYDKALHADEEHLPALRALARHYTRAQEYDRAIEYWRRAAAASDDSADALSDLGYCQDLAGRALEAEESYRKAIVVAPLHVCARVNYGLMLARHGRGTEALCQLQTVLTPAEARYNLALAYEQVGKTRLAQAEFRRALAFDPELVEAKAHLVAKYDAKLDAPVDAQYDVTAQTE